MKLIDFNSLHKPIYAEDDNITGSNMTYQEMDGYNEGIDTVWNMLQNAPTIDAVPAVHEQWISVKDKLPEENNLFSIPCIVAIRKYDGSLRTAYRSFERKIVRGKLVERWLYPWETISDEKIEYWMPLPEPPTPNGAKIDEVSE